MSVAWYELLDDSADKVEIGDAFSGVRGSRRSRDLSSSLSISGWSTRCESSMASTGRASCDLSAGSWGADTLRSPFVDLRRTPNDVRLGPAEDGEDAEFPFDLPGPNERRLRKERKPLELEGLVLTGGCVGLPLTARRRDEGVRPSEGAERELGRVLCDGRGAFTGMCDCGIFGRCSTAISHPNSRV